MGCLHLKWILKAQWKANTTKPTNYNIIFATKTPRKNTRKYLANTRKTWNSSFSWLVVFQPGDFFPVLLLYRRIRSLKNHTQTMPSAISMRGWKEKNGLVRCNGGHPRSLKNPNCSTRFSLSNHDFQQYVMNNMFLSLRPYDFLKGRSTATDKQTNKQTNKQHHFKTLHLLRWHFVGCPWQLFGAIRPVNWAVSKRSIEKHWGSLKIVTTTSMSINKKCTSYFAPCAIRERLQFSNKIPKSSFENA